MNTRLFLVAVIAICFYGMGRHDAPWYLAAIVWILFLIAFDAGESRWSAWIFRDLW